MSILIRPEQEGDADAIGDVIADAFARARHRSGNEAMIVRALRAAEALALSLVAEDHGQVIGFIGFSPVQVSSSATGWVGLGPLAVSPSRQGEGIGAALVRAGLDALHSRGVAGCVVVGDPAYYGRFGFVADPAMHMTGVPREYFHRLELAGPSAHGIVTYDPAFGTG